MERIIKKWRTGGGKFTKEIVKYGSDMPLTGFGRMTGSYGMYSAQSRHRWFGIKGVFGYRYSIYWGINY